MHGSNSTLAFADESYAHEAFETFQFKVIQLCLNTGFGEPSEIQRMKGGAFNRVIGLAFALREPQSYVLRIPRIGMVEDISTEVKNNF